MKRTLTLIFALFLCVPMLLFTGCGTKMCDPIDLNYYFEDEINCSFFYDKRTRDLKLSDLEEEKPNTDFLDSYSQIIITSSSDNSRIYHLYIDYITFYVYFNESSEFDFNLKISIPNMVSEENVWEDPAKLEDADRTFTDTYSTKPKEKSSSEFKVEVKRVISVTTGTTITFDLTENNEIFKPQDQNNTDGDVVTFRWFIYGLEIHAEARAY